MSVAIISDSEKGLSKTGSTNFDSEESSALALLLGGFNLPEIDIVADPEVRLLVAVFAGGIVF
ncbi:MAG: hypothetical protein IPP71_22970 [Bacteroidetes bacterium]|nr:hypothetical protein [Bacteroidota bacterium]